MQASSRLPGTLAEVRKLLAHPELGHDLESFHTDILAVMFPEVVAEVLGPVASQAARQVTRAPKPGPRIMRYELTDYECAAIKPLLPNKHPAFRGE